MANREDNSLLEARCLKFSYGQQLVFDNVDLRIDRREIVCLIGASGCGKSTLLRILAGLDEPQSGEVSLHGRTDKTRAAVASVVFQSPALLPWLSVAENVGFGLDFNCRRQAPGSASRNDRARLVRQALEQVGLGEHATKRPRELSGGMAQRTALARALARDPEIIYLDEPFSALDAVTRESMQDLLVALVHDRQSAALLVTHDLDEALRIGDRVLLLAGNPGRIVGEWRPPGIAPRLHRSSELNELREDILNTLSEPACADSSPC